jgi:hypothetical protein
MNLLLQQQLRARLLAFASVRGRLALGATRIAGLLVVGAVAACVFGLAMAAHAEGPAPAATAAAEPERLEDGWNLPPPPLPAEALEGTALERTVRIRRADGQPVQESWLKSQVQSLELDVGGTAVPLERSGSEFKLRWTVPAAGEIKVRLRAKVGSETREGPVRVLKSLPNVRVKASERIDFAAVAGGCALDEHCKPIDFKGSQALRPGQKLAISRPSAQPGGAVGWPELLVHVRAGVGQPLQPIVRGAAPIQVEHSADKPLELCYAAPRCLPVPASAAEAVLVQPIGRGLIEADRAAAVVLLAAVSATPWWLCYLPFLLGAVGLLLAIFIAVGIFKPKQFPKAAMLFVGAQESQLVRDGGRPLYSAPGGRRGFYRSAAVTFDASGMTVRRGAGGALVLHAHGNEIRVEPRTDLEVKERSRWRPVPQEDKLLQRGAVYRVGKSFYFRIDW